MNEPRTLTEALNRVRDKLVKLTWTDIVQGRVALHAEKLAGHDRPQPKPMVHVGNGEYLDCRPSDLYKSVIFFASKDSEKNEYNQAAPFGHSQNHINRARRAVTLYGWVNLAKLPGYDDNSGFPEPIKIELKRVLQTVRCVIATGDYADGSITEVFKPFVVSDMDRKYDRWPYACFSLQLTMMTIETNPLP
ncbi:hypothetical protein GCM10028818_41010 [Spirosoma horti]